MYIMGHTYIHHHFESNPISTYIYYTQLAHMKSYTIVLQTSIYNGRRLYTFKTHTHTHIQALYHISSHQTISWSAS